MVVVDVEGSVDAVAAVDGGGSGAVVRVASRTFVTSFCPILPVEDVSHHDLLSASQADSAGATYQARSCRGPLGN